jgi:hypothetical protein
MPRDGSPSAGQAVGGTRFRDLKNGETLVVVSRLPFLVWSVALSPAGETSASAGWKGVWRRPRDRRDDEPTVRLWEWIPAKKTER